MEYKKDVVYINKILRELYYCEDVNKFYQLSSMLYYKINNIVFGLDKKYFNVRGVENGTDNRADSN